MFYTLPPVAMALIVIDRMISFNLNVRVEVGSFKDYESQCWIGVSEREPHPDLEGTLRLNARN
jgi:hypothetical protein